MAQTYEQWKKSYESLDDAQKKQYADIAQRKGADYIGSKYLAQYNSASTPQNTGSSTSSNTGSTYTAKPEYAGQGTTASVASPKDTSWDKGNGTYTYNEKSGYYESNGTSGGTSTGATGGTDKAQQVRDYWNSLTSEQQQKAATQDKMKTVMQQYGLTIKPSEGVSETPTGTKGGKTTKQGEWDYQDNSQARMDQILNNLNGYRQTNPELFKNSDEFYNFFIKDKGRSQDQIDYLWNYFNNVQKYSKYDNMPASSLGDGLANGTIPQDYLDYLKSIDPAKYQEVLSYKQDSEDTIKYESYLSEASELAGLGGFRKWNVEEMGFLDKNDDGLDDRLYHAPTEEELKLVNENSEYEAERLKLKNAMKWLQDDLTEQYPDADLSTIMLLTSDRGNKIQKALDTLSVSQTKVQGTLAYLQNERATMDAAGQQTINELQKNLGLYYSYSPEGIREMTEAQYAANNITLDQADSGNETQKQMALDNVLTPIFEQYGDIIERSKDMVINDVIAYAKKNGVGLRQALEENFMKYLKNKPAYKSIQAQLSYSSPETVKIGDEGYYWDATTQSWKPITGNGTTGYMYSSIDWSAGTGKAESRTERNNNPTAMTTDVAKSLGMVEGVDYVQGDSFKDENGKTLYTAKLLGDPIQTTIDAFNAAASRGTPIFYTKGGAQRWKHTAMSNEEWLALSDEQKAGVIAQMLQREGGQMGDMAYYVENGIPTTKSEGGTSSANGKVTPEDIADWASDVDKLFEANVLSGIPIQLRNTNVEKEYYLSIIDELYKQGITDVFEASQMINGFVINNTSIRAKAAQKQVLDVLKATSGKGALPSETLQAIASEINNGNYSGAYKRLETAMGEFAYNTNIPSVQTYTPQGMGGAMTAISAIEKINPLGWTSGNLEDYLEDIGLEKGDTSTIQGNLTSLGQALMDMGFDEVSVYGGKTSGGKGTKVEGLLPSIKDNSTVFKKKLANIEDIIVRNTNQRRKTYGLPEVTRKELFSGNYNSLYLGQGLRRPYGKSSTNTQIQGDSLFDTNTTR